MAAYASYLHAKMVEPIIAVIDRYIETFKATGTFNSVDLRSDCLNSLGTAFTRVTVQPDAFDTLILSQGNTIDGEALTGTCLFSAGGLGETGGPGVQFRCGALTGATSTMSDVVIEARYTGQKLLLDTQFLNLISGSTDLNGSYRGTITVEDAGIALSGRGDLVTDEYASDWYTSRLHRIPDGGCFFDSGNISVNPSFPRVTATFDASTPADHSVVVSGYGKYEHTLAECGG